MTTHASRNKMFVIAINYCAKEIITVLYSIPILMDFLNLFQIVIYYFVFENLENLREFFVVKNIRRSIAMGNQNWKPSFFGE